MAAKQYPRHFAAKALEVPDNWADRKQLLSVPHVMTITGRSYDKVLEMVRSKILRPADCAKPYRFAPSEIIRVFFTPQPAPGQIVPALRSLKTEGVSKTVGHKSKPKREELWL